MYMTKKNYIFSFLTKYNIKKPPNRILDIYNSKSNLIRILNIYKTTSFKSTYKITCNFIEMA